MSVRQRLYPTPAVARVLVEHCQHARFVYNIGLEQRSMWRADRHNRGALDAARITTSTQSRELTDLRAEVGWLRAGSSSVQQGALRDLDRAFSNFFAGRAAYPKFKRRTDREGSFVVRDLTVRRLNRKWGTVLVPKVGAVRFRISRTWAEIAAGTSARITLRNGRWHVSITCPPPVSMPAGTGAIVGIDRGVKNTLATSEGVMLQVPSLAPTQQARLLALQRTLSRQQKGSARRQRTLDRIAVLRRTLDDQRRDWVEHVTTDLARSYDFVAVEDLRVQNMVRRPAARPDPDRTGAFLPNGARAKSSLSRSIFASVWGRFLTRLDQKMPEGHVLRVDPRNTSRTCVACGHCAPENRESQAVFECASCGHTAHADTNAAENIMARGLLIIGAPGHGASGRRSPADPAGRVNQSAA